MFLWSSSTKIVQAIWIRQKTWPPRGRDLFSLYICIGNFKSLRVRNHWTDFNIILQKCSFGRALPRLFKPYRFVKKDGRQGARLIFPIYIYMNICIENFKNFLVRNHLTDFNIILQKCFFGDPLPRLFKPYGFVKTMSARGRGLFSLFKNLVRNDWIDFNIILQKCSFGDPLPRLFKPFGFVRGRGLFSLYICIENFKNFLVRNHLTDFNIILQKCFFGDPLPRLFKPCGFVEKHGRQRAGFIIPIYLHSKF